MNQGIKNSVIATLGGAIAL